MAHFIDSLITYWHAQGVPTGTGATERAIAAFERSNGVRLPADVRAYFARVNGTAKYDDQGIVFRPLDQVESVAASYRPNEWTGSEAATYFLFADYLAATWEFAIQLSPDPEAPAPVAVMWGPLSVVAASFSEFMERYLRRDPDALEPPKAEWERIVGMNRAPAG